jgi:tRNA threonylcarbamoyl adenosine modification protein YeaZ
VSTLRTRGGTPLASGGPTRPKGRGRAEQTVILAIDTATPAVTAGIVRRDDDTVEVLAERVTVDARAHAEQLTPNVVGALADARLTVDDLDAVVVGCGPGPFTGLRVGMATAAAFGHALGVPVHGVCSLDAIGIGTTGDALVVTDARRREVYWARYRDGIRVDGPAVNAPADVPGAVDALTRPPAYPTVAGLVRVVAHWTADPAPLVPLYLRRPDAKPRSEQQAAAR